MDRLFVYGTLRPGGVNAGVLAGVEGEWEAGVVRGRLGTVDYGGGQVYPGLVLDGEGDEIAGDVLTSGGLGARWGALDAFEGEKYRRVVAEVVLEGGERVEAQVYVAREGA